VKHEHADLSVAAELSTVPLLRLGDEVVRDVARDVAHDGGGGVGVGDIRALTADGEVVVARGAGGRVLRRVAE